MCKFICKQINHKSYGGVSKFLCDELQFCTNWLNSDNRLTDWHINTHSELLQENDS